MYSAFMDHLIDHIPEKWVEISGGPMIRAISHLFPSYPSMNIPYSGIPLSAPWGFSSGWADSLEKMDAINRLGAGLVVSKTITLEPRIGNPYPRIIRHKPSMINSMGLPNPGLKHWLTELNKRPQIPENYVFSLSGETLSEWQILIKKMKQYNRPLELNFSCPNVAEGVIDLDSTTKMLNSIHETNQDISMYLKLSPQYGDEQLLDLIDICMENKFVRGITVFNTFPVKHEKLGNPRKSGGLSGPALYPRLLQILGKIRHKYRDENDLPVFAIGGITNLDQIIEIYEKYNAIPMVLTAFLMQGPLIFKKWLRQYSNIHSLD